MVLRPLVLLVVLAIARCAPTPIAAPGVSTLAPPPITGTVVVQPQATP